MPNGSSGCPGLHRTRADSLVFQLSSENWGQVSGWKVAVVDSHDEICQLSKNTKVPENIASCLLLSSSLCNIIPCWIDCHDNSLTDSAGVLSYDGEVWLEYRRDITTIRFNQVRHGAAEG